MPIVSRTLIAGDYLMALVKSGSVKMLSAYLPNDALVTMHNLRNFHGKEKKGVGLGWQRRSTYKFHVSLSS